MEGVQAMVSTYLGFNISYEFLWQPNVVNSDNYLLRRIVEVRASGF